MNFIKSIAEKSLLLFLIFFFIYPIRFFFFPVSIRLVFAALGVVALVFHRRIDVYDLKILRPFLWVLFFSILAVVINGTTDFSFLFYCFSLFVIWLAAYFIFSVIAVRKQDFYTIIRFVVYAILIQSFLSTIISTNQSMQDFLLGLIVVDNEEYVEAFMGSRFIGWGVSFFSAGRINGLGLICISYLMVHDRAWSPIVTAAIYGIILGVGIMLARTTIVGCGISIAYIFFEYKSVVSWNRILRFFIWLVVAAIGMVSLAFLVLDERILEWAFELFINYTEYGSIESSSTDRLQEMYFLPQQFSTYLFGDGLFSGPDGSYYMGSDVGYIRLLFYFGVFGSFLFIYWHYYMVRQICNVNNNLKYLAYVLFVYCLVLNIKGLTDLCIPLFLVFFAEKKRLLRDMQLV